MVGHHSLKVLFHVKHDTDPPETATVALGTYAGALGLDLAPSMLESLAAFERLLANRAESLGLVAGSDTARIRERHVVDCLRAVLPVGEGDRLALDLGSGAGLPGLVVALARPQLTVRLIEPRRRRIAFLELAIEQLHARNATVLPTRVEEVHEAGDLCFARAFAPIGRAWESAQRLLRDGGRLVYFAGAEADRSRIPQEAAKVEVIPSVLASSGPLIIMTR